MLFFHSGNKSLFFFFYWGGGGGGGGVGEGGHKDRVLKGIKTKWYKQRT